MSTINIDWNKIDEIYKLINFIAMDDDGSVHGFQHIPTLVEGIWIHDSGDHAHLAHLEASFDGVDYKNSLICRNEETVKVTKESHYGDFKVTVTATLGNGCCIELSGVTNHSDLAVKIAKQFEHELKFMI